jgi:hypothetical protein
LRGEPILGNGKGTKVPILGTNLGSNGISACGMHTLNQQQGENEFGFIEMLRFEKAVWFLGKSFAAECGFITGGNRHGIGGGQLDRVAHVFPVCVLYQFR